MSFLVASSSAVLVNVHNVVASAGSTFATRVTIFFDILEPVQAIHALLGAETCLDVAAMRISSAVRRANDQSTGGALHERAGPTPTHF